MIKVSAVAPLNTHSKATNDQNKDDQTKPDSAAPYISAHNVLNMLNDCTKCWHLAFCNELPDVVTCFLA
jgi:hypothetical protein